MGYEPQKAHVSRCEREPNAGLAKKDAFSVSEADFLSVTDISNSEEKNTQTCINFEDRECQTEGVETAIVAILTETELLKQKLADYKYNEILNMDYITMDYQTMKF